MVHALLHPDFWSAAAVHSGDMGFELMYRHEFPRRAARAGQAWRRASGNGSSDFWAAPKMKDADVHVIMMLAQAATFDPDPEAPFGVRLPVDASHLRAHRRALGELARMGSARRWWRRAGRA